MTRNQIMKALEKAGFNMAHVAYATRDQVEIFVNNGEDTADEKKTTKAIKEATKILGWRGGYYTGYGAMVLQASPLDLGDFNDKSSRHHY